MDSLTFLGGLLLGAASSLHCAGMCGSIASSLMFALAPDTGTGARIRTLLLAQGGKALAYVAAGGVLGLFGSVLYGAFDQAALHQGLRVVAALCLAWIGFSLTGLAPPLSALDGLLAPLSRWITTGRFRLAQAGPAGPVLVGMAWGLMPCGMVYGALFYAMLSGDGMGGALVMSGFALGTLPAVTATALGILTLRRLGARPGTRIAIGLALVALATASVVVPTSGWAALCRSL